MKRIIPFVALAVIATSIYSCQKDSAVKPKATSGAFAKAKKDTVPPSATFKVVKDTVPPSAKFTAAKDTVPPSK